MTDALDAAARTGRTAHSDLMAVSIARRINQECGGAVIAPWQVAQLDATWLDVFDGLAELPNMREQYQAVERRLMEIRKSHPTYRKYRNG